MRHILQNQRNGLKLSAVSIDRSISFQYPLGKSKVLFTLVFAFRCTPSRVTLKFIQIREHLMETKNGDIGPGRIGFINMNKIFPGRCSAMGFQGVQVQVCLTVPIIIIRDLLADFKCYSQRERVCSYSSSVSSCSSSSPNHSVLSLYVSLSFSLASVRASAFASPSLPFLHLASNQLRHLIGLTTL